ncbi:tetratricopeptide repeat protein, partial [bacterium]
PVPPRRSTVRTPRPTVRTTPVILPEALIDDSLVVPPEEARPEPLEIETSSLADSELDLVSITPQEPVADLLRADDAAVPTEGIAGLETTIFETPAESEVLESVSGLEIESTGEVDLEEPVSLLENDLVADVPVEPLDGVEHSFGDEADLATAEEGLLVLDSVPDDGNGLLAEEEIEIEVEPPTASEMSGEVLDDGTDWEIPEDMEPVAAAAPVAPVDGTPEASLSFLQVEEPSQPSIEELEDLILDDPDNAETHRALGEALLASGDTVRGIDELDLALLGYENREDWEHALDLIGELIRVDPASVRYYQKRVEVAYRTGDKARLIDAYLELGDALVRSGALEKALAVYRRVVEHEPQNVRATSALMSLAPPEEEAAAAEPAPPGRSSQPRASAPAVPKPATPPPPSGNGDFIDLGSLVMEDDETVVRDTRMRVEDEEPTGDEEKDFKEMLSAFKRGIEQNLDDEDFQSHYDLGVAFKEMGLLDEAIAEFQKALRSPQGRLRTSEALGVCFYEKGQFPIVEAILRRAIDSQPGNDDEKVGLLYWLARSYEAQSKVDDALTTFRRVMAVDIRF